MALKGKIGGVAFWEKLGREVRDRYRKFIFEDEQSVYGDKWWNGKYTKAYETAKKTGGIKRQAEDYANKVTPVLTGDTQKDVTGYLDARKNGVKIGYPSRGNIVNSLRKKKGKAGTLTDEKQPLPKPVQAYLRAAWHRHVKSKLKPRTRIFRGGGKPKVK